MAEQMQSSHIRYLLGVVSLAARKSLVIEPRDGQGAAESGVSR
jgi:hypothetical protein